MNAPQELGLAGGSKRLIQDLLVAGCGLVASFVTALILWVVARFGFAFYTWMFWFVVPVGALLSGFAGASGYLGGAWFFGHRPTRLLMLNIVITSLLTFFLIHYLAYITTEIDGKNVSDYIPFSQYLNIAIRSTSMKSSYGGSTGELGSFGYVIAALQVIGFAVGGFTAYAYLAAKTYCDKRSRYLSAKGTQIRYSANADELQTATGPLLKNMANGDVFSAVEDHRISSGFGSSTEPKDCHLRSIVEVRHCKKCRQHWTRFAVEKLSGNDEWEEISGLSVARFTDQIINIEKT
jgi:hypothetical protein